MSQLPSPISHVHLYIDIDIDGLYIYYIYSLPTRTCRVLHGGSKCFMYKYNNTKYIKKDKI